MHTPPPASPRRARPGPVLLLAIYASFAMLAPAVLAQPAINSVADNLPLRNVRIEVRQIQTRQDDTLRLPDRAPQGRGQHADDAIQQVLVLNGRSARIALGTRTPMRVLQTVLRNGVQVAVAGTLVWDADTGFVATPRWSGADTVELEMAAFQNLGASANQTRSMVLVPLALWVTVAESDTQSDSQRVDLDGMAQRSAQTHTSVQVRLTLP